MSCTARGKEERKEGNRKEKEGREGREGRKEREGLTVNGDHVPRRGARGVIQEAIDQILLPTLLS